MMLKKPNIQVNNSFTVYYLSKQLKRGRLDASAPEPVVVARSVE